MTNQNNGIILYTDLDQLPKIGANGEVISPGTAALMGGVSSGIGKLIEIGVFGSNNILKLALSSGDVLNKVLEISFRFVYDEKGFVSGIDVLNGSEVAGAISVDIFNALIDTPAQYTLSSALLAAAAPIIGSSVVGVVVGATVIGAGVSYVYPYIRGFTNDAFNSLFFDTGKVDMQFTDANGEHNSGLFFKDGMGDLSDKAAIAYFLENSGENTHGGTFNFSTFGLDRSYDVYDASIYQSVAEKLGIELEEFLAAGYNGKTNFDGFIGGAAYSAIFNKNSPSLIYIPVKVNGVTEVFLVNGIYIGDIKSDAISMGRNIEAVLGNSLILDGKDGSLVIRQHSSDPLVEDNYIIVGDAGSNNINTEDGNDTIVAGGGDDKITAGYGRNVIDGGEGVDTVDYSFLSLGSRDIVVNLENHTATNGISLNRVNDTLYNIENIIGSDGDDVVTGNSSNNTFTGGEGNDVLSGGGGEDKLYGGAGDDNINGGEDKDLIYGDAGDDSLDGGFGDDSLYGGADDDKIDGGNGNDFLSGGSGNDVLRGGFNDDELLGNDGDDKLDGESGNDVLLGGRGFDTYNFSSSFGVDTVNDSDRFGKIVINGNEIKGDAVLLDEGSNGGSNNNSGSGGSNNSSNDIHQLSINGVTYYLKMLSGVLLISQDKTAVEVGVGDVVKVEGFVNGQFGINLKNPEDPEFCAGPIVDGWRDAEKTDPDAYYRIDPLTLDLDGDGVELVSLSNSNAFFDLDGDGLRENVGWIKSDDGILVYDANGSGGVDNINELFGL